MPWLIEHRLRLLLLGIIALGCAIASFLYFTGYSTDAPETRRIPTGTALGLFTLSAPFVLGAALLLPGTASIACAKIHAALYTAFIAIIELTSGTISRSSLADSLVPFIRNVLLAILLFELVAVFVAAMRLPELVFAKKTPDYGNIPTESPWLFTSLTAALLGGWAVGGRSGGERQALLPGRRGAAGTQPARPDRPLDASSRL